jgi:flagellar hook-basal body complex protein FliE
MANPVQDASSLLKFRVLTDELTRIQPKEGESASFADVFKKALNDASDLQSQAQDLIGAFVRGEPVDLHQVMSAAEEANISLELLVEIRNKLTEAYRTVMNLQ